MPHARYSRQTILAEIGPGGQRRLGAGSVLCIGAGGLGCATLPYMAAAGVGRIMIIDHDRVDISNLHRQVLFAEADVGRPKAEAAAARLAAINGGVAVEALPERLDLDNVERLFGQADVVIDGSDNYATKYLAADAALKFGVPLVYASATGMEAMVTVFEPGAGPCLRCLFPQAPSGWVPNCAEAGVLGPLVGAAGAIQAAEAIKLLVGDPALPSLSGRLWLMDARDMSSRQLVVTRRDDCPTCSRPAEQIVLAGGRAGPAEISRAEAEALDGAAWIDVREPDEYAAGHFPGALNLPLSRLREGRFELPGTGRAVLYCASGQRCRSAAEILEQAGLTDLRILRGGYGE